MGAEPDASRRDTAARVLVLAGAGALGALAFPGSNWAALAWIWLVPALVSGATRPRRAALLDGWLTGTVFYVLLLRWLDYTFRHYSAIPWPLTWLPIVALAAYCGLYVGVVAGAVAWLRDRLGAGPALTLAPPLWVVGEWLRGWLMGGFPWGLLGYSQHAQLPVIQIAELGGVYAVSLLIVAVNAALAGLLALGPRRAAPGAAAALVLLVAALAFGLHTVARASAGGAGSVEVAVIQPSIAQTIKWDPTRHAQILDIYERLTREAARARPAVVLWPETATTIFLRGDPVLLERLSRLSEEVATPILVGSLDRREGPRGQFLNSAFLLTGQGITAKYDKIHLVPFGEYVPLAGLLGWVKGWAEFISEFGVGDTETVFPLAGAPFGTVICYEVIFPELFRGFVARGAGFMANITNDAWFGETSGPWQHLGMLPLRAVEHRVAIARAANTGVSAFVEPTGRIGPMLPLLERGVLHRRIPLRDRTTLYTRLGDWLVYTCAGLGAAGGALAFFRRSPASC
ncbi:MAG TPA: apolipoprotein N-acyltransferase [Candidatus Limnocylindria bacterium]|nr:apolipoprotein N-acyltransferase [Candidatus Limnocylindria bacterium]